MSESLFKLFKNYGDHHSLYRNYHVCVEHGTKQIGDYFIIQLIYGLYEMGHSQHFSIKIFVNMTMLKDESTKLFE